MDTPDSPAVLATCASGREQGRAGCVWQSSRRHAVPAWARRSGLGGARIARAPPTARGRARRCAAARASSTTSVTRRGIRERLGTAGIVAIDLRARVVADLPREEVRQRAEPLAP